MAHLTLIVATVLRGPMSERIKMRYGDTILIMVKSREVVHVRPNRGLPYSEFVNRTPVSPSHILIVSRSPRLPTAPLSPQPPGDAALAEIVRGHFHFHTVSRGNSDPALAHLAANRRQNDVLVLQFHTEHRARKHHSYHAFYFNVFFFCLIHFVFLKSVPDKALRSCTG